MNFAALQSRANSAVAAHLMTDAATLEGAEITGKFTSAAAVAFAMLDGSDPVFTVLDSALTGAPRGKLMVIGGAGYAVRRANPDGEGMTHLALEELSDVQYAAAVLHRASIVL